MKAADVVFWVMKINSTIRVRKPTVSDDHNAPARVNATAGSLDFAPGLDGGGGGPGCADCWGFCGGCPGEAGLLGLLIVSSLSHPAEIETKRRNRPASDGDAAVLTLVSAV
ncbi:hypothetical protein MPRM_41550 [Mycobacterium parmense]|uniref:Uncharacterized protein n=1 Tax=Mycobacterium parmense TaxID=185642 RepID=A0A7I7Z0V9_9MYCO|nr:hypothetical protein MPRM_41550 [Mycobacterium parmense]